MKLKARPKQRLNKVSEALGKLNNIMEEKL